MSFVSRYIAYIKRNPEGYWFKRKAYGWGWVPATWQGWIVLLVFVAIFCWIFVPFVTMKEPDYADVWSFLLKIFAWAVALIFVCYIYGERPRWQWGIPEDHTER